MTKLSRSDAAMLGLPPSRYQHILDKIVSAEGEFVAIPVADLGGDHPFMKQTRLLTAARRAGVKITTTSRRPGQLFARLLPLKKEQA